MMDKSQAIEVASRLDRLNSMMSRINLAWSPLLRDRLISIHVGASDARRHMSDTDVIAHLGFDPTNVDELAPPWLSPDFE